MNVWMGVLLALATAAREPYNGPNGLDPSALTVLVSGDSPLELDFENSGKFLEWLYADANVEPRAEAVAYFVRCAFGPEVRVRIAPWPEWRGRYGLAPNMAAPVRDAVAVTLAKKGSTQSVKLKLDADEGKWVSSCLVAMINRKGLHQVVSLRGNHAALQPKPPYPSLDATRWTMGYPEGVFFADLLNFKGSPTPSVHQHPGPLPSNPALAAQAMPAGHEMAAGLHRRERTLEERERSFTIALNVKECGPTVQKPPPNVPLGRTLTSRDSTCEPSEENCEYRIARRLGFGEPDVSHAAGRPPADAGPQPPLDPDHAASMICVEPGDAAKIVPCPPPPTGGASDPVLRLRPLFVHLPRFIRIADVKVPAKGGAAPAKDGAVDASLSGTLDPSQIRPCNPVDCVGPFHQLWAGGAPSCALPPGNPGVFTGLRDDQTITATLNLLGANPETPGLKIDPKQTFTALIRYRSEGASRARVLIPKTTDGSFPWETIEGALRPGPTFQWLQVYPVRPVVEGGKTSLRIQLQGVPGGKGFPELDVVGFVPGYPWCLGDEPRRPSRSS